MAQALHTGPLGANVALVQVRQFPLLTLQVAHEASQVVQVVLTPPVEKVFPVHFVHEIPLRILPAAHVTQFPLAGLQLAQAVGQVTQAPPEI